MLWLPCSGAQYGINPILRGDVVVPLFRGSVRDQSHITQSCCGSPVQGLSTGSIPYYAVMLWPPVQGLSTGSIPYYAVMLWFPCSGAQYKINPILRGHVEAPCSRAQYGIDPILRGDVVVPLFRG